MRTTLLAPLVLSLLSATACSPPAREASTPPQYAFAREWISMYEADRQSDAEAQLRALRERWMGKRFAWEVELVAPLCRDGACNVRPFDYARLPTSATTALGGAMPTLALRPESWRAIILGCAAPPDRCVAAIDATIAALPDDAESPLMMRLEDGHLRQLRARLPRERFARIVRPRLAAR